MAEHPLDFLNSPRVRNEIESRISDSLDIAMRLAAEDVLTACVIAAWYLRRKGNMRDYAQQILVDRFGRLPVCSARELETAAIEHLICIEASDQDRAYERFVHALKTRCAPRVGSPFAIAPHLSVPQGQLPVEIRANNWVEIDVLPSTPMSYAPEESNVLAVSMGFELQGLESDKKTRAPFDFRFFQSLPARVAGVMTAEALVHAERIASTVLKSILSSLRLIGRFGATDQTQVPPDNSFLLRDEFILGKFAIPEHLSLPLPSEPPKGFSVDESECRQAIQGLRDFADAFFGEVTRSDLFGSRLRNAIYLLVQADESTSHSVRLALSFSSIEALLCRGAGNVTKQLAENVATILQHDSVSRLEAITRVTELYNVRSKVIHGERVEIASAKEGQVRRLAAGCLFAVLEWRKAATRFEATGDLSNEFFDQLAQARVGGRRMVGVPENAAEWLPPAK